MHVHGYKLPFSFDALMSYCSLYLKVPILVQFHRRFKFPRIIVDNKGTEEKPIWEATFKHWNKLYKAQCM